MEKLKRNEAGFLKSWFSSDLRTQHEKHQPGKLLTQSSPGNIELIFSLLFFSLVSPKLFLPPLALTHLISASAAVFLHSDVVLQ